MPAAAPAITIEELVVRYADRTVVDRVSFSVARGEIVALLGPNGAGKTTTATCVAGLRPPDSGAITVLGADPVTERASVTARLGVMPQEPGCHRQATPRELARTFARLYRHPWDPDALLERVGLGSVVTAKVRTLSGGERQRLSLALALVGRPGALLLDEPTAGVDPHGRRQVWSLISEQVADGVAILLTTHLLEEAERLADMIAVLDRGRLVAWDSPARLAAAESRGLVVDTPEIVDESALAAALGVAVEPAGTQRWRVHAGPDRIPDVAAWFAAQGLPIHGIKSDAPNLEDLYLRLTTAKDER